MRKAWKQTEMHLVRVKWGKDLSIQRQTRKI